MRYDEYQEFAISLSAPENDPRVRKGTMALGLIGETVELLDAIPNGINRSREKFVLECGDVIWYISVLASIYGAKLSDVLTVPPVDTRFVYMLTAAKDITEAVKKEIGHGHPPDNDAMVDKLRRFAMRVTLLMSDEEVSIQEVIDANVAKLRKRYANGFNTQASMRRIDIVS